MLDSKRNIYQFADISIMIADKDLQSTASLANNIFRRLPMKIVLTKT